MARLKSADPILQAAEHWRDRCLIGNRSVFSEQALWTEKSLNELDRYFVQNPQAGEGDFFSKLETQLEPASPETKKLAAEMLWVMYLIVWKGAMSGETKRYQIRKVWEWSGDELPEGEERLGALLNQGIAHPGAGFNAHRWREFRFFITMMEDWKELGHEARLQLSRDPWSFAEWLEEREFAPARQLRHILLFLLFPDEFEPIATASHKRQIVDWFRREVEEDPDDFDYSDRIALDKEILRIRKRLCEQYSDEVEEIDFYQSPIRTVPSVVRLRGLSFRENLPRTHLRRIPAYYSWSKEPKRERG